MNKKTTENIIKTLPAIFKNAADYVKDNFAQNGKKIIENSGGTFGVLIGLFAQPLIDKYYKNLSERKLENFGFDIYIKSSLLQAIDALEFIKDEINNEYSSEIVFSILNKSLLTDVPEFDKKNITLIFQPKYHPAATFVKNSYIKVLRELNVAPSAIKDFQRKFNEGIETRVAQEFGDDYESHLKKTEDFRLSESETNLLWDIIQQGKIGFKETEDLKYEVTYAFWKKVSTLREADEEAEENGLEPINELIEEYFGKSANSLRQILFVIADFGKGKSVFMKHYAADLAKEYLLTHEGYFPVYFNLRNFKNYSSDQKLGVIGDFLQTDYSIKIDDPHFQKNKYIFLIDSLDESGELSKRAMDKVINSVKSIQGINKSILKKNRIIITSRPFDDGLHNHLKDHEPFVIKNKENRDIEYFINVYGFTKVQFNNWLIETLTKSADLENVCGTGFTQEIVDAIKSNKEIDIYDVLLQNETLSLSELRRPIFAYMIYQLIINNIDFLSIGKIGVYLSFLNLLTKEAKHIHDHTYKVNLKEEFEFRNILHTTASLWMYERQRGKQGALKKADICRALDGENKNESDSEILERFKNKGLLEIQFLSHSYFGENDNILHFQHQSFAEILLAEYYIKIIIKYSLDENVDYESARIKMMLGEPTEQTILFLKEMLQLLRETATSSSSKQIIEKRKLLFPLMASLATTKNSLLFCNDIYYSWFKNCNLGENQSEYPTESLVHWCINQNKIEKIVSLTVAILHSRINYLPIQGFSKVALFNPDILALTHHSISRITPDIDRWLALLIGNYLHNENLNTDNPKLFNRDYTIDIRMLFEMIRTWQYTQNDSSPTWGKDLFQGIDMKNNNNILSLDHCNLSAIDFSYSHFKNFTAWGTYFGDSKMNYCIFEETDFVTSTFYGATFDNIKQIGDTFTLINCTFGSDSSLDIFSGKWKNIRQRLTAGALRFNKTDLHDDVIATMRGFVIYGITNSFFTMAQFKKALSYETEQVKQYVESKLDALKVKPLSK